ncbi:MAG: hypothetical protein ABW162_17420 [Candidatus Sedimenticola sp. PURPLELP]
MKEVKYDNLRMKASACGEAYSMDLVVASGFTDFIVTIRLNQRDFEVIENIEERAALLCAALHHPFQLRETALNELEQRNYLEVILHEATPVVEHFLTEKDHGNANGAISNFMQITTGREQSLMRKGQWFNS